MNKILSASIAGLFFLFFLTILYKSSLPGDYTEVKYNYYSPVNGTVVNETVPKHYIAGSKGETGSQNVVTAIVVLYRGFDTLGEVTVLFTAATGVGFLMSRMVKQKSRPKREPNFIASIGVSIVLPFILLVGAYLFIHGHLTPGGGFPGGAVIATGFALMLLAYPEFFLNNKTLSATESFAGLTFVLIGLISLLLGLMFLQNYLPKGTPGELLSAGIIPLIYIAIGFKVGAELSAIAQNMKECD